MNSVCSSRYSAITPTTTEPPFVSVTFLTEVPPCVPTIPPLGAHCLLSAQLGDVPMMIVNDENLVGNNAGITLVEATPGEKEDVVCSDCGYCNELRGTCDCFENFYSSDGDGNPGTRGDCGRYEVHSEFYKPIPYDPMAVDEEEE